MSSSHFIILNMVLKVTILLIFFIVYNKYINLLIENPEILMTDLTYKINRFNIPLINIIRMTGMNRLFFNGNIFILGEKKKDYKLVFFAIRKLYNIYKLFYPKIFVTDVCAAEIAAIECIFPGVNH